MLFKYPFDPETVKIHKSPAKQKEEDNATAWAKIQKAIVISEKEHESYETYINLLMEMDNLTREQAESVIANKVLKDYDISKINVEDIKNRKDMKNFSNLYLGLSKCYTAIFMRYDTYTKTKNMAEIAEMIKQSDSYKRYASAVTGWEQTIDYTYVSFIFNQLYNRQPTQTAEDIKAVLNLTLANSEIYYKLNKRTYSEAYNHIMSSLSYLQAPQEIKHRVVCETIVNFKKVKKIDPSKRENFARMASEAGVLAQMIWSLDDIGANIK